MLYQSLLLSVILYGYPAWNASISSLRSLESFQKKILHWILPSLDYVSAAGYATDLFPAHQNRSHTTVEIQTIK